MFLVGRFSDMKLWFLCKALPLKYHKLKEISRLFLILWKSEDYGPNQT